MTVTPRRVSPAWLRLREPADAAARSRSLAGSVTRLLAASVSALPPVEPSRGPTVIHDLGSGTGSMTRWLAPRLAGPQRWVLHDVDSDLLARAYVRAELGGLDRPPVRVEARHGDVTRLDRAELVGAALVTASALLDLLSRGQLECVVRSCVAAQCPALLTLTVVGRVELSPPDPWDADIGDAFNAHQRRRTTSHELLGPDAVPAAVDAFSGHGYDVSVQPTPWVLGAADAALTAAWLAGWVAAACEARSALRGGGPAYLRRRHAQAMAGLLRVTVHHQDLLAVPR